MPNAIPLKVADLGSGIGQVLQWAADDFLPVSQGGTGAITAAAARANLGLGSAATVPLVGTVTNGGGATVQTITTANGTAVRWPDGTQICWAEVSGVKATTASYGAGFISSRDDALFPIAFQSADVKTFMHLIYAAAPVPTQAYVAELLNDRWANHWYSPASGNVNMRAFLLAVGRWF